MENRAQSNYLPLEAQDPLSPMDLGTIQKGEPIEDCPS